MLLARSMCVFIFCVFSLFSPFCARVYRSCLDHNKRSSAFKTLTPDIGGMAGGQGGYATNFGGGLSGESQVIAAVFKTMVSRFCDSFKELKSQENIALYCDVRQLVTYVKGAHGGPFRLVALSGILSVTPRPHKKAPNMQTTRVIRCGDKHFYHISCVQRFFNIYLFVCTDIFSTAKHR